MLLVSRAQNRAAQRAFRERKERHLRELEIALRQITDQRDFILKENNQLKTDIDMYRAENWYLKGIVLTLQLVCYENNLVIPQHSPYLNEPALSIMAQSMPESISAYLDVNAHNKLPIPSKLVEPIPAPPSPSLESTPLNFTPRDRSDSIISNYVPASPTSTNPSLSDDFNLKLSPRDTVNPSGLGKNPDEKASINIMDFQGHDLYSNFDGVDDYGDVDMDQNSCSTSSNRRSSDVSLTSKLPPSPPPFHSSFFDSKVESVHPIKALPSPPNTCRQTPEEPDTKQPPPMSAIAAIQAIRLKLRQRLVTQNDKVFPPHIQPTILQVW